jgi:hypothetical protein
LALVSLREIQATTEQQQNDRYDSRHD